MKKIVYIPILTILIAFLLMSCEDVLNKENLTAVNPSDVWSKSSLAQAYLDDIYAGLMPGNPNSQDNSTDEQVAYQRQSSGWMQGTATSDSWDGFGAYGMIRTINIFLGNIDGATFEETTKSKMKGQALFWRAWCYYGMVKGHGGVPLILEAQQPTDDLASLAMPRNKTSECVTQIIKDLDDAIALLPGSWDGNDMGRIDKGAVMAFKGRVLLFFASPLFNQLGGVASWQKAYDANKAAVDFLVARGTGLYYPYGKIWDDELNKEVIMVRRFNYPQTTYFQGGIMPLNLGGGDDCGYEKPSLEVVNAFPMKDGSSWDPATMSYDTLFKHRDDRFYASIYYNGDPNPYTAEMIKQKTYLWTYFHVISNYYGNIGIEGTHNPVTLDALWSSSSFYRMKAVDKDLLQGQMSRADVDWPEIRYAEVLMNYGECANELNKTSEALDVLYKIRARAGSMREQTTNTGLLLPQQTEYGKFIRKSVSSNFVLRINDLMIFAVGRCLVTCVLFPRDMVLPSC